MYLTSHLLSYLLDSPCVVERLLEVDSEDLGSIIYYAVPHYTPR